MLIFTIGDVLLVLFILVVLAANAYLFLWDKTQKKPAAKDESKPEPRDTTPKPLPKLPIRAWLILAVQAAVLIAIIWFVAHTLKI